MHDDTRSHGVTRKMVKLSDMRTIHAIRKIWQSNVERMHDAQIGQTMCVDIVHLVLL